MHRRGEGLVLPVRPRLDDAGLDQGAQHGRVAVVAQPAGVHRRRHEIVAQRVHGQQWGQPGGVAEVVAEQAAGQRRAGRRFGRDEPGLRLAAQHPARERERQPGEVRATANAADHHVRLVTGQFHLRDRLDADHGLVQQHVVEHRAQRVVGVLVLGRDLDGLGDGDAQRARGVLLLRAAGLRELGRGAVHRGAPGLHHRAPVGLLVVARADHEDLALQPEQGAGERQ